jgi:hypothetical protein
LVLKQAPGKSGLKSAFSSTSREAVPKSDILEQPLYIKKIHIAIEENNKRVV